MRGIKIIENLYHSLYIYLLKNRYLIEIQYRLILSIFYIIYGQVYLLLRVLILKVLVLGVLVPKVLMPGVLVSSNTPEYTCNIYESQK